MKRATSALIVLMALLAAGCFSRLTGNKGKFVFGYPASADIANFNKPIAPGARLDLYAFELGSGDEMAVVNARSLSPEVLEVVGLQGEKYAVVRGVTNGTARIEMTVRDPQGRSFTDTVDMLVAKPETLVFQHLCTDDLFAAYPANADDVVVPFGMQRRGGQPVIGYGFHPVKVSPTSSLKLRRDSRDQGALHFRSGAPRHRVAIRSRIDDAYLGLALVEPTEVDDVIADSDTGVGATVVGAETMVSLRPLVSGVPLCQSPLMLSARSTTPDICEATARLGDDGPDENSLGLVRVKGVGFGICEFEVRYDEANGGAGLTRTFRMPIGKFPSLQERVETPPDRGAPWWLAGIAGFLAPLLFLPLLIRDLRKED